MSINVHFSNSIDRNTDKPVFFVASRGHHADIGGISPGSMPPHSTSLLQEGAAFKSFLLVESGTFKEEQITKALTTPTGAIGATGTRNLADNLSDLKAQVAANQKGIQLVSELIDTYGLKVVQAYMNYIQKNAEVAVRDMLKEIAKTTKERYHNSHYVVICNFLIFVISELVNQFYEQNNSWTMVRQSILKLRLMKQLAPPYVTSPVLVMKSGVIATRHEQLQCPL